MKNSSLRSLCEGALVIALATILGFIKVFELPQGGSITLGMFPIFVYCYKWGLKKGLMVSFAYGILQLIFDGAYAWSPWSMVLDYVFAYGVLGICGLFTKNIKVLIIGTVVATFCRFIMHFISGVTIYRIYEPTVLFNCTFTNPIFYSVIYNGSFLIICLILDIVLIIVLQKYIDKYKKVV